MKIAPKAVLVLNSLNVRLDYSFFRYPYSCLYPISFEQVVKKGAKLLASQRNVEAFLTRSSVIHPFRSSGHVLLLFHSCPTGWDARVISRSPFESRPLVYVSVVVSPTVLPGGRNPVWIFYWKYFHGSGIQK